MITCPETGKECAVTCCNGIRCALQAIQKPIKCSPVSVTVGEDTSRIHSALLRDILPLLQILSAADDGIVCMLNGASKKQISAIIQRVNAALEQADG